MDNVTVYNGKRTHDVGRKAALEPDPYQIQIVVDGMENGLGLSRTHLLVNEYKMQMANNQLVSMLCKDLLNDSTKKWYNMQKKIRKHYGSRVCMGSSKT